MPGNYWQREKTESKSAIALPRRLQKPKLLCPTQRLFFLKELWKECSAGTGCVCVESPSRCVCVGALQKSVNNEKLDTLASSTIRSGACCSERCHFCHITQMVMTMSFVRFLNYGHWFLGHALIVDWFFFCGDV